MSEFVSLTGLCNKMPVNHTDGEKQFSADQAGMRLARSVAVESVEQSPTIYYVSKPKYEQPVNPNWII